MTSGADQRIWRGVQLFQIKVNEFQDRKLKKKKVKRKSNKKRNEERTNLQHKNKHHRDTYRKGNPGPISSNLCHRLCQSKVADFANKIRAYEDVASLKGLGLGERGGGGQKKKKGK